MTRDQTDAAILRFVRQQPHPVAASLVYARLGDTLGLSYGQVRSDLARMARAGCLAQTRDENPQHRSAKLAGWRSLYSVVG